MSVERHESVRMSALNLPNQLTGLRLVLAVVLFGMMAMEFYLVAMVLFIIAASTDWLDGYYARRYGMVTTLGRILDPFADKVIICGTFIFLVAVPEMLQVPLGLRAWMVVVIVGRELLVTALRSFIEDRGGDFSAKMSGKLKMLLQCIAAGAGLFYLDYPGPSLPAPAWVWAVFVASLWAAVALTVYSGMVYILAAVRLLQKV
ncbi:MAG: CDP-diacylglycerol--glycerol-3-phosphate 3-phosphatidyltransferase [Pirellulales bacterium]|nr:CDP-diacylglycerol--glycerol-3-phosphate 3-phosphatidyltransferase [Pirellulales bacterium]